MPALAYDQTSVVLAWDKPDDYSNVVDYKVYMDGTLLGLASDNNTLHSPAKPYIDKFYQNDTADFHVKARIHNFTVDGLTAGSHHKFTVRSVFTDGSTSSESNEVTQVLPAVPTRVVNILTKGATAGDTSDQAVIQANTAAIQSAIDSCSSGSTSAYDCEVLVPTGIFKTGALFLKSNMTFKVEGTLKGSEFAADYPREKGYKLYTYKPIRRSPSLLNALEANDTGEASSVGAFRNIRIVGSGTLDGNGWLTTARTTGGDGANTLTVDEVTGQAITTKFRASSASGVATDGILAAAQNAACAGALVDPNNPASGTIASGDIYGNCRASMGTFRGVKNLYFAGLTVSNPAFHGLMFLENENVTVNASEHRTYDTNNGDGLEFGNSSNAIVMNNFFDTGDDVVNFAAGIGSEAATQPPQTGTWIFNNYIREGHGAVALGSNTGSWIEKIKAEDNVIYTTQMGLRMKSTPTTGGGGRDILFRDNAMKSIKQNAFIVTLAYTQTPGGVPSQSATPSEFKNVVVRNVSVDGAGCNKADCTTFQSSFVADGSADTGNSKATPIEISGVSASAEFSGAAVYHSAFTFDTVKFNNVTSVRLYYLKNSSFNNVSVTNFRTITPTNANSKGACGISVTNSAASLFSFTAANSNIGAVCP